MKTSNEWTRRGVLAGAVAVVLALAGCAPMATYNAAYVVPPQTPAAEKVPGKALVYTLKSDDETPFVGPPTSFTGSATKLTIPLGVITREIAFTVFNDLFAQGAAKANSIEGVAGYRVIVQPKVASFSYGYYQLQNLGFAITPTVVLSLDVTMLDGTGKVVQQRRYESGKVEGKSYMMSGEPGEEIGKVTHRVVLDLMQRAAKDVREVVRSAGPGAMAL